MADNPNHANPNPTTNTNWFRSFTRSNPSNSNNTTAKPQQPSPPTTTTSTTTTTPHPAANPLLTLQIRHDHRHRVSTPFPTTDSPPRHHHHHHHGRRKSAGATLRTVSSFLSLKSSGGGAAAAAAAAAGKSGLGQGGVVSAEGGEAEPELGGETEPEREVGWETGREDGCGYGYGYWGYGGYGSGAGSAGGAVGSGAGLTGTWYGNGLHEKGYEVIRAPAPVAMLPLTDLAEVGLYGEDEGRGGGGRSWGGSDGGGRARGGGEGTWYNPNLMQMVEMLSAVMARKGAGEPLDLAYNSCVLSLIEGFYRLTRKLHDTEEQLAELKDLRERELEQFRGMTEEWMETREAYKAEIKRLELTLAKESKDGVASVALARHGSLVDRAGSKRFQDRLKRMSNGQNQDAAREKQASKPSVLAEATTSSRRPSTSPQRGASFTANCNPRILDFESDVLVSRMLERRETEDWTARQEQRREGRVRAGPVLVRSRGTLEPRDVVEQSSRTQPSSNPFKTPDDYPALEALNSDAGRTGLSTEPPQPRPQRALSIDNESSSSDSSASTETESGFFAFKSSGKAKGQPKKASKQHSESSGAAEGHRKGKAKLPRLWTRGEHPFVEESSQGPALDKKQRKRCYSFEKGDDELLSVASPTWPPGMFSPPQAPVGEEKAVETESRGFLGVLSGQPSGNDTIGTPRVGLEGPTIKHSTSTNTVKWVGDGNGAVKSVDGKAGHGQAEESG